MDFLVFLIFVQAELFICMYTCVLSRDFQGSFLFFFFPAHLFHFGFACSCLQRINFMIKLILQL